jgi:hypothetical protein
MHGVRIFIEPVFYRGRHGQESKEIREGSHEESGKEDFQEEEEVTVSTTDEMPPPGRNQDTSDSSSKNPKMSFAAIRYRGRA